MVRTSVAGAVATVVSGASCSGVLLQPMLPRPSNVAMATGAASLSHPRNTFDIIFLLPSIYVPKWMILSGADTYVQAEI
jgi:hypothetical protein